MPTYFEDLEVGAVRDLGRVAVSASDIVDFAERWDPLEQHVDAEAASAAITGGLVASGLHTVALSNRLAVEGFRRDLAGVVGLGFEALRFAAPVRPGDELRFSHEIVAKRPSESDSAVGVVTTRIAGERADELVVEYEVNTLVTRRAGGEEDGGRD